MNGGTSRPPKKYRVAVKERINKLICELCNFHAQNKCQLDVDHIDGNHDNNDLLNLQVICSNCHRLKTYNERNDHK